MRESRHLLEVKKQKIEADLHGLFQRVMEAIAGAMDGLDRRDLAECARLIRDDAHINALRHGIEQDCLMLIASQQPVAHDLRDIIADMRIASELERIGDYARDIAASVQRMDAAHPDGVDTRPARDMAGLCQEMLNQAMRAHRDADAGLARQVGAMDDQLDARMKQAADALMAAMRAAPDRVNDGSQMLWIAHNLERCGDRATNIAEQVVFRVEGSVEDLD